MTIKTSVSLKSRSFLLAIKTRYLIAFEYIENNLKEKATAEVPSDESCSESPYSSPGSSFAGDPRRVNSYSGPSCFNNGYSFFSDESCRRSLFPGSRSVDSLRDEPASEFYHPVRDFVGLQRGSYSESQSPVSNSAGSQGDEPDSESPPPVGNSQPPDYSEVLERILDFGWFDSCVDQIGVAADVLASSCLASEGNDSIRDERGNLIEETKEEIKKVLKGDDRIFRSLVFCTGDGGVPLISPDGIFEELKKNGPFYRQICSFGENPKLLTLLAFGELLEEWKATIEESLDKIKKNKVGRFLLDQIQELISDKRVQIAVGCNSCFEHPTAGNGDGIFIKLKYSPLLTDAGDSSYKGTYCSVDGIIAEENWPRPLDLTIFHELLHFLHFLKDEDKYKQGLYTDNNPLVLLTNQSDESSWKLVLRRCFGVHTTEDVAKLIAPWIQYKCDDPYFLLEEVRTVLGDWSTGDAADWLSEAAYCKSQGYEVRLDYEEGKRYDDGYDVRDLQYRVFCMADYFIAMLESGEIR